MNRPLDERDEFLLSRLLDGDLPEEQAAELRSRMQRDPELHKAYAAMTRLESLLVARRADQPRVDWDRFHSEVMSRVEAEAAGGVTIRLANYLRVALPLAAAAAIVLAVWLWPKPGPLAPAPDTGLPTPRLAARSPEPLPAAPETGIVVRYHRFDSARTETTVRVSYARSDQLSKEYRALDEESRNQQPSQTFLAGNVRQASPLSRELLIEASSSLY